MKHRPFPSQPPHYVGPRRTDRPRKREVARNSGRKVSSDRVTVAVSDDELDALFIRAMADDEYAHSLLQHFLDRNDEP